MSGPKDFTIQLEYKRMTQAQARIEAERIARALASRATLHREKLASVAQIAKVQAARATTVQAELEEQRHRATAVREQLSRAQPIGSPESAIAVDDLQEVLQELAGWRAALNADEAVRHFGQAAAADWGLKVDAVVADFTAGRPIGDVRRRCESLLVDAQSVHDLAGTSKGQFDTRNELLTDVIASLKEIGFHVDDPFFERPDDPAGPVVLRATCGSETVTAHVDLGDHVRTIWDGVEADHCRGTFFEYMDRMKSRGVDVVPDRADLHSRPTLLKKSANELPGSQSQNVGG